MATTPPPPTPPSPTTDHQNKNIINITDKCKQFVDQWSVRRPYIHRYVCQCLENYIVQCPVKIHWVTNRIAIVDQPHDPPLTLGILLNSFPFLFSTNICHFCFHFISSQFYFLYSSWNHCAPYSLQNNKQQILWFFHHWPLCKKKNWLTRSPINWFQVMNRPIFENSILKNN